ncbi:retrovirus-related pol polyprotein from transposon TNT 1-94 [Tanacetum coccineum]|uniref:Retrovirus-related pol polyprotein from transposon TNT 1-94 n=1 Tax=Tanacetum coccineum TaxID=301880 RepID=A0ABQ4XND3_9ASTR
MEVRHYNDALVCCVENTIDDHIMDSGASFRATYCKEELERFKLHSGKVCLADDKTLDIAGVGNVSSKLLRYKLDSKNGFRDQQWKVTKGSLVVTHGNKRRSMYMVEVPCDEINVAIDDLQKAVVGFCEPCVLGKQKKAAVENETNLRVKCLKSNNDGEYSSREFIKYCAENGIRMLKTVPETPQQNDVVERMNQTLNERAKSMRFHAGLPKMFGEDSVNTTAYLINRGPSCTLDSDVMEKKSVIARINKVSSPDGDYIVIYIANGNFRAFNCLLESDQQDWKIVTWRLYEACGVYILELEDGIIIYMLVKRRYPLSKDLLQRMLDLRLEVERESIDALDLIRFIKQHIDEE